MTGASMEEIDAILERTTAAAPAELQVVVDDKRLLEMGEVARNVVSGPSGTALDRGPRGGHAPRLRQSAGGSQEIRALRGQPSAGQAMVMAAKVHAAAGGRTDVAKEDLAAVIVPALRHRILLNFEGQAENVRPESLIDGIVKSMG